MKGILHAQTNATKTGSGHVLSAKERQDSIASAMLQKRKDDSIARETAKIKLQQFRDSIVTARNVKRKADSLQREQNKLAIINKKHQSDSLAKERIRKLDSLRDSRLSHSDSLKKARESVAKQRKALEKYKNSRRCKDSVASIRKSKSESLAAARKAEREIAKAKSQQTRDSLITIRNHINDSIAGVRKHISDSTSAATKATIEKQKTDRQHMNDSLAAIRTKRSDSLAAIRKKKEGNLAEAEKKKEKKDLSLAIKMIHEKKQEEWTNEKLLKRKWSLPRRIYQNTVTRYNYFYNARRKYNDAITNLKKNNKDDYFKIISLYPYDIRKSGTSVAGEMDSVIKKSSFSTQIHDPRSKWFDNLYFLMGRASYVKNDFDGAISTFQFVANEYKDNPKKKKKVVNKSTAKETAGAEGLSIASVDNRKGLRKLSHHPIRNQALVWLAKSYIESEQYSEASALISTLEKDKVFPKRNKAELYMTKASLEIQQNNNKDAIASLDSALHFKMSSLQKARIHFVIGQLYASEKEYAKSSIHFKKSISGKANPEMDFYTKLFIAENAAKGGGDKQFAINQLDKIIKDPKYQKYKDQATNVLAAIYAEDNADKAIEILAKSVKKSDSKNPLDKATSYALLGKLYYAKADYESAKISYDSAAHFGTNPALDNIDEVNTRKDVLTDVVKNIRIIRKQDSMLMLSQKTEKEQKAWAKKEAERLKKLEEPAESQPNVVALTPGVVTKSNWYFYNNNLMEKGMNDFKQKWGVRKLEDNWRRATASSAIIATSSDTEDSVEDKKLLINGSQYETLLAEIPKTHAQKDKANDLIMNAYYDLGLIYYAQLEDYKNSVSAFDSLLKRYPTTSFKKQSYYSLFLDHSLLKNEAEAARYKKLLQDEFGQSEFAKLASNPNYVNEMDIKAKEVDHYYDTTYLSYKEANYTDALSRIEYAQTKFKGNTLMAKFDLLQAVCHASIKEYAKCKSNLEHVIQTYPSTKEQAKAQELLNYLNSSNALSGDSLGTAKKDSTIAPELKSAEGKGVYAYDTKVEHLLMVYIAKVDGRTMALKAGLSDFNQMKHDSEELATGQNLFTVKEGVVTVSKFSNAVFAKIYLNDVVKEQLLFQQFNKDDYSVCLISTDNFNELLKTRDILGYLDFYKKNYK